MRVRFYLGVTAAFLAAAAQAQNNDPLSGEIAVGYLATSGNSDSASGNASLGMTYTSGRYQNEVNLAAIGARSLDETTAESYAASYELRREFGTSSYVFGLLDWDKDRFSGFDRRTSETVGYGNRLIDNEQHRLSVDIGAGARQAQPVVGPEQREGIVRGALDYVWVFTETSQFRQNLVVESGSDNTHTESVSALRARLLNDVGLVVSYTVKHNSDVPLGREKTDKFTSIALEYAF
jgi:putative salt-induced outer membrane protein